jgi:hypothetical protein
MKCAVKIATILFIIQTLFVNGVVAQQTLLEAKIDSASILIGQQTVMRLTMTVNEGKQVILAVPADTLMSGIEILSASKPDTTLIENNRWVITQDLLITSFDADTTSKLYYLPPIMAIDGADTIYSNRVSLKVSTLPVNVDKPEEFYDIATVWKPPFMLSDYYPLIFGILFGLLLIAVAIYIIRRIRNKKPLLPFVKTAPPLPPHKQAINELDHIKEEKLWQQGRNKEYYTRITETLRRYIDGRFGVNAMEMTSGDILDSIKAENEADSVTDNLKQILVLADFVKFAKHNPLPDENELSMMNAYLFVNQTKPSEPLPEAGKEGEADAETQEKKGGDDNDIR